MPSYDAYAYEALGHLIVSYQSGEPKTRFGNRRVPVQIVTLGSSENEIMKSIPFLQRERTRVWHKGFSTDCLDWLDWGN